MATGHPDLGNPSVKTTSDDSTLYMIVKSNSDNTHIHVCISW